MARATAGVWSGSMGCLSRLGWTGLAYPVVIALPCRASGSGCAGAAPPAPTGFSSPSLQSEGGRTDQPLGSRDPTFSVPQEPAPRLAAFSPLRQLLRVNHGCLTHLVPSADS